jgi:hypothetical protein
MLYWKTFAITILLLENILPAETFAGCQWKIFNPEMF